MNDTTEVRGRPVDIGTYRHPRWSDGTPILIDDEVQHADEGWGGFVAGVPNSEEVDVCWYDEYGWSSDAVEYAPEDLVRIDRVIRKETRRDGPSPERGGAVRHWLRWRPSCCGVRFPDPDAYDLHWLDEHAGGDDG